MDALDFVTRDQEFDWSGYYAGFDEVEASDNAIQFWRCGCGETNATASGFRPRCVNKNCDQLFMNIECIEPVTTPVL